MLLKPIVSLALTMGLVAFRRRIPQPELRTRSLQVIPFSSLSSTTFGSWVMAIGCGVCSVCADRTSSCPDWKLLIAGRLGSVSGSGCVPGQARSASEGRITYSMLYRQA
ncbi:uncharacterized protein LOC115678640 isoform X2 [Syzygium oleosum]|uniref:uncharacterized protein LOC115678640 isoform X2 n=1 Tax=Syzygium oleosum TaxID=219896 RepID=UPI0024B9C956|nr:uncharacterized protein LOC115678640 isoform X2 [Syzygium oleosum]